MFSSQLDDDDTLKQDPHPEPGSEPQPLKETSLPSYSDTCAVEEKSGHAPHGGLPIAEEGELSHPNEAPFQISPEAALPAQPIPELAEPGSDDVRRSDLVFTPTVRQHPRRRAYRLMRG
jgi:hypothetical protein